MLSGVVHKETQVSEVEADSHETDKVEYEPVSRRTSQTKMCKLNIRNVNGKAFHMLWSILLHDCTHVHVCLRSHIHVCLTSHIHVQSCMCVAVVTFHTRFS